MNSVLDLFARTYLQNSVTQWALAVVAALFILCAGMLVRRIARKNYERFSRTETAEFLELPALIASRTSLPLLTVVSIFAGLLMLTISPRLEAIASTVLTVALFWQVGVWVATGVVAWIEIKRRTAMAGDRAAAGSLGIIAFIARVVIWSVVLLLTLDNLGVNITALVAGLGVGGIAVALAVQNVLGDLLASLSITLDRPFVVGDFLILGDFLGSVEYIGIKSTRLRSLTGEQIIMSNADLLSSRVRNYGRMSERRVVFSIRVPYETPLEKLERVPALLREIVEAQSNTRFDRSHFAKYELAWLEFEVVYYVLSADYNRYMDTQQAINFRIYREFQALGVEFAYPTQKLWLAKTPREDDSSSPREREARSAA